MNLESGEVSDLTQQFKSHTWSASLIKWHRVSLGILLALLVFTFAVFFYLRFEASGGGGGRSDFGLKWLFPVLVGCSWIFSTFRFLVWGLLQSQTCLLIWAACYSLVSWRNRSLIAAMVLLLIAFSSMQTVVQMTRGPIGYEWTTFFQAMQFSLTMIATGVAWCYVARSNGSSLVQINNLVERTPRLQWSIRHVLCGTLVLSLLVVLSRVSASFHPSDRSPSLSLLAMRFLAAMIQFATVDVTARVMLRQSSGIARSMALAGVCVVFSLASLAATVLSFAWRSRQLGSGSLLSENVWASLKSQQFPLVTIAVVVIVALTMRGVRNAGYRMQIVND